MNNLKFKGKLNDWNNYENKYNEKINSIKNNLKYNINNEIKINIIRNSNEKLKSFPIKDNSIKKYNINNTIKKKNQLIILNQFYMTESLEEKMKLPSQI